MQWYGEGEGVEVGRGNRDWDSWYICDVPIYPMAVGPHCMRLAWHAKVNPSHDMSSYRSGNDFTRSIVYKLSECLFIRVMFLVLPNTGFADAFPQSSI